MAPKAEILTREVVTVHPGESVGAVARLMREKRMGCVLVVEEGKLVGVFTERDLAFRVAAEGVDPEKTTVSAYMTRNPKTVDPDEPLTRVFELLSLRRFRHVPIVKDGRPVGIVSLTDLAGVLNEVFAEERYQQYFVSYFKQRAEGR